jgi:hypothetical protein
MMDSKKLMIDSHKMANLLDDQTKTLL